MYCKARGIPQPDPVTYAFCMALSIFRGAAILAGVGARAQQGNASSAKAAQASSAGQWGHVVLGLLGISSTGHSRGLCLSCLSAHFCF